MSETTPGTNPIELAKAPPRNWFYALLNLASLAFVATALAYAVVPVLEQNAAEAGNPAPALPFRSALRENGWWWLLIEAGIIGILALASMGLDRWRQRNETK
jgi:uncharacterized membrane protein